MSRYFRQQIGLKDCGIGTACRLARYGVGDELLNAALNMSENKLTKYLREWRQRVRNLLVQDPKGYIGTKSPSVARNLTDNFPKRQVLRNYTHPITSWSGLAGMQNVAQIPSLVPLATANLEDLAGFVFRQFEWNAGEVHAKFKSLLWEGLCLRMLITASAS